MRRKLTLQLPDATWVSIDQDEWTALACPIYAAMRGDGKFRTDQLFVRKHPDGRHFVYVTVQRPGTETTAAGELLPAGSPDVEGAVRRMAKRFSLPDSVVDECVTALRIAERG